MATSTEHDDCGTCGGEGEIERVVGEVGTWHPCPSCGARDAYDGPDEAVDFSTINWRWR